MKSLDTIRGQSLISIVILIALTIAGIADAACPDMSDANPAELINDKKQRKRLQLLIPLLDSEEDARSFKVGAYVKKDGRIEGLCCLVATYPISISNGYTLFRKLKSLRFSPASDDGKSLKVYVRFTILATKTADSVNTIAILNHMLSIQEFGTEYTAPQRIWGKRIRQYAGNFANSEDGEIIADIDRHGSPSRIRLNRDDVATYHVRQRYLAEFEDGCFIPGFADGSAVAMPYKEMIGYH